MRATAHQFTNSQSVCSCCSTVHGNVQCECLSSHVAWCARWERAQHRRVKQKPRPGGDATRTSCERRESACSRCWKMLETCERHRSEEPALTHSKSARTGRSTGARCCQAGSTAIKDVRPNCRSAARSRQRRMLHAQRAGRARIARADGCGPRRVRQLCAPAGHCHLATTLASDTLSRSAHIEKGR